jgi:hypothetical protein
MRQTRQVVHAINKSIFLRCLRMLQWLDGAKYFCKLFDNKASLLKTVDMFERIKNICNEVILTYTFSELPPVGLL